MNIEPSLSIPGWMNEPELYWLADQASHHSCIVEIGCWMGRSTITLAINTPGVVYAVDTWLGSEEHKGDFIGKHPDWVYAEFLRYTNTQLNIYPIRRTSVETAAQLSDLHPDMVFIDAAHDYDSICADILAWRPLIRSGGLLCGHDHGHPPIERAVRELIPDAGSTVGIWHTAL
jgi:hypothetical protein